MKRLLVVLLLSGCTTTKVDTVGQCSWDELILFGYRIFLDVNCSNVDARQKQDKTKKFVGE
jgi:hypothetical protein